MLVTSYQVKNQLQKTNRYNIGIYFLKWFVFIVKKK